MGGSVPASELSGLLRTLEWTHHFVMVGLADTSPPASAVTLFQREELKNPGGSRHPAHLNIAGEPGSVSY